ENPLTPRRQWLCISETYTSDYRELEQARNGRDFVLDAGLQSDIFENSRHLCQL
ncbi:MAG: hypothetical protein, partial [Olavius algarvensis spirochete endosymbiont]